MWFENPFGSKKEDSVLQAIVHCKVRCEAEGARLESFWEYSLKEFCQAVWRIYFRACFNGQRKTCLTGRTRPSNNGVLPEAG